MKFLIVDDDLYMADLVASILRKNDVEVKSHLNMGDALRNLMEEEFDGIIMDLHMPGIDGFKAIPLAKGIRPGINVGLMTSDMSPGVRERTLVLGADFFVQKSEDIANLWEIVKKQMRR